MKKIVLSLLVLAGIFAIYWFQFRKDGAAAPEQPKQQAIKVAAHSPTFNNGIDSLLQSYFTIHAALVDTDSTRAKQAAEAFTARVAATNIDELKKDTSGIFESASTFLTDVKSSAESMTKQTTLTEMRQDFKSISENMYPLLKTIHYEGKKLYWQNCPMAFGEDKEANWISSTEEIMNPYMGKNHPEFKSGMLHCGEVKDTIQ